MYTFKILRSVLLPFPSINFFKQAAANRAETQIYLFLYSIKSDFCNFGNFVKHNFNFIIHLLDQLYCIILELNTHFVQMVLFVCLFNDYFTYFTTTTIDVITLRDSRHCVLITGLYYLCRVKMLYIVVSDQSQSLFRFLHFFENKHVNWENKIVSCF